MTVIVRGKIDQKNEWVGQQYLFRAPPELYTPVNAHYGARFIFDKANHLFYTIGERNVPMAAQDLSTRWIGAEGQPVRQPSGRSPQHLELRPSSSAGTRVGSGEREALGIRTRAAGR
jgi:glucose/arabinose dehydrogenase